MKKLTAVIIIFFCWISCVNADSLTRVKLQNGQTLIIKEVHNNPTVITDTWIKTGSIDENDTNNGVAHFLEHLFFKGSENYPDKEFDKILESKGAITNAATSKDFTHYYILIPSKDFETALAMQADMLLRPTIPPLELEKERNVVIREIDKNNDLPHRVLYKNFNSLMYTNHPYKREVIGTKEIIGTVTRDEILKFYNENYAPENMITVIAGDITAEQAIKAAEKYFIKRDSHQKIKKQRHKRDKRPDKVREISSKADVNTAYLLIGFKGCSSATSGDSYALDIIATMLGEGKSSRLYRNVKDNKKLVQSIGAGHSSFAEDSILFISADLLPENLEKAKKEIFAEIRQLREKEAAKSEIDKAKSITERGILYSRESISDITSEIGYTTIISGDWMFSANYLKNLNKVDAKAIKKAARKYLNPESAVISIITPTNPLPPKEVKANQESQEVSVKDKAVEPGNFFTAKTHSPVSCEEFTDGKKYILDNGATLITEKHDNNEIIAIKIKVKGGNYDEKIKGLSIITADVMTEGTKKYPKTDYAEITEENGIHIIPSSERETFSISLKCTKADLPQAKDLLYEIINNATLSEGAVKKSITDALHNIRRSRDIPSDVAFEELQTVLWNNTPYGNTGKVLENTLPLIKREDVQSRYKELFDPKNIIVAVNGNINEQEMINYFSEVFNGKNAKKIDYKEYADLFPPIEKTTVITTRKVSEAAWIVFGRLTDGKINTKDRMTLNVINALLGSGMSSRLFTEVRDQKGLAYTVASSYSAGVNKGSFTIYTATAPEKVAAAKAAIEREIERLKKEFVTEKELLDAKNKLKGNYILANETNGDKAELVVSAEVSGDGCKFPSSFEKLIDEVTVNDIITAANKYFSTPYVLSEVIPKK